MVYLFFETLLLSSIISKRLCYAKLAAVTCQITLPHKIVLHTDMTLWVKLDYKNFYSSDDFNTKHFTDIASVKKWFREENETDYSVVKHDGKLMKDTELVPKTTKDNCLHLLREIRKAYAMTFYCIILY